MLQDLIDSIAAPGALLKRLKQKPTFWVPLLLLVLGTISAQLGYFLLNDEGFVRDQITEQALSRMSDATEAQRRQVEDNTSNMNITMIASVSSAAVLVLVPIIMLLNAWYLGFMARFSFSELGFRHWLALISWTGMPTLFAILASWIMLLTDANGQVSQTELQPLSIIGLLGLDIPNQTLQQLNLTQLWTLGIAIFGYRQWTQASWLKATLIVLAPSVVIYGAIAYFTL